MDPDPSTGDKRNDSRYTIAICIDGIVGCCKSVADRLVRGSQAEQARELKNLKLLRKGKVQIKI